MYAYIHDKKTGGLLLTNTITDKSNEPRPVYAKELDILGINKFWKYRRQNDVPYMWAEANKYFYKGEVVFTLSGGDIYHAPTVSLVYAQKDDVSSDTLVLPIGTELCPVDIPAMIDKNKVILATLEQITIKGIYRAYRNKLKDSTATIDCFYVAFSGGKDSVVLLHLVKKALPKSSFIVVFGDTKMEFPDTYQLVDQVEKECKEEEIEFYRASSHFDPDDSWRAFGPPSRTIRWCCSVHKSAPQVLTIRKILGKSQYTGLAFVGVRAHESISRSKYEELTLSGKQKGQYSYHAIHKWTSAEIWLYTYSHNLIINKAYKGGANRVGCLMCPMGGGKADYVQRSLYPENTDRFINIILSCVRHDIPKFNSETYISSGGWNARKTGRDLVSSGQKYEEVEDNSSVRIILTNPSSKPEEWIKTLSPSFPIPSIEKNGNRYVITVSKSVSNRHQGYLQSIKKVLRKAEYCIGCKMCEANCCTNSISFSNGLNIQDCIHCGVCHEIDGGCLRYASRKKVEKAMPRYKSINNFSNHAPKTSWIDNFFDKGNEYFVDNTELGPRQLDYFIDFLSFCSLFVCKSKKARKGQVTHFYDLMKKYGVASETIWGVLLVNLTSTSDQFKWYVENMQIGTEYQSKYIENLIKEQELNSGQGSTLRAFGRICDMQLGKSLNFGTTTSSKRKLETLTRTKCYTPDPLVLLYALYRYAEACEGYYQFTLSTLLNTKMESAGVSPVKIFGYTREELRRQIEGLSARYPEFIGCSFTHDLEVVNLRPDKKSGWEEYSQPAPENDAERAAFQKNVEMKKTVLDLFYERD